MANRKKVLIVDDNPNFIQLMQCSLEDEFDCICASNGREGLEMVAKGCPDVILMDIMMPDISGLEMLRELLAEDETKNIPVLVLTGSNLDSEMETVFRQERNVKGFMNKTVPINIIIDEIKKNI
ncbi:MAG: response regulator [Elusimicrobiales bacterium]|nr:response regulator [Elusimicrobiales bacterium]